MAEIDKIKGEFYIYSNGEYVVLPGSKLYILRTDGSLVACRSDLRHAGRITFLSGSRMLLCSKDVFHMIDLRDGSDLWTAPYEKTYFNLNKLAISPDEAYAYTYDENRHGRFISRLSLNSPGHEVYCHEFSTDLGATKDILCDEDGVPCLLKTLTETIGGKTVHQGGVRIHDYHGIAPGGTTTWKTKWSSCDASSLRFFGSTDRILTSDLHIFEPDTGKKTNLLENETARQCPNQHLSDCWQDPTERYLFLRYQTATTIIDLQERKIAAQYAVSGQGCLVGDEYWIYIDKKLCRKRFPAYEDAPPFKPVINMDWYYAKHPELW